MESVPVKENTLTDKMNVEYDPVLGPDVHPRKNVTKVVIIFISALVIAIFGISLIGVAIFDCSLDTTNEINKDFTNTIIISDDKIIWAFDTTSRKLTQLVTSENGIAAFELHTNVTLFWIEKDTSIIRSISKMYKNIEFTKLWKPQAIVLDPITELLFMIDKLSGTLNVLDTHRRYYNVILSDLNNPHDLFLDTTEGLIFIMLQYDSILTCNVDGSDRRKIIKDSEISAMSVDQENRTIYWATISGWIKSSNYHGLNKKIVTIVPSNISSIAILHDELFWTQSKNVTSSNELCSCKLINTICTDEKKHRDIPIESKVLKASSYNRQIVNNCDNNGNCQHLCLSVGKANRTCACHIGWQLNPDAKTCFFVKESVMYVQGNFFRAKIMNNTDVAFTDTIIPRHFYTESLEYKRFIDYTYDVMGRGFFFTDDHNIFKYNIISNSYDGQQKKIYNVSENYRLKNIEFDVAYDHIYVVRDSVFDARSIETLVLNNDNFVIRKANTKADESIFLTGPFFYTLYTLNWDKFFNKHRKLAVENLQWNRPRHDLRYYNMYKLVTVDNVDLRVYWMYNNQTITKMQSTNPDGNDKKFVDVPLMMNAMSFFIYKDWIVIGNSTGIWKFNKSNGSYIAKICGGLKEEEGQSLSTIRLYVNMNITLTEEEKDILNEYYEVHIGV